MKRSILTQRTRLVPDYDYVRIVSVPATDALTWKMALTDALTSLGGIHGAAVTCDIMSLDGEVGIVRCSADSSEFVRAAVGSASRDGTVFRVVAHSSYLPLLID